MSYQICGGFGIVTGLIGLIMVREPMREDEWYEHVAKENE
jgi:hypothetical protein